MHLPLESTKVEDRKREAGGGDSGQITLPSKITRSEGINIRPSSVTLPDVAVGRSRAVRRARARDSACHPASFPAALASKQASGPSGG